MYCDFDEITLKCKRCGLGGPLATDPKPWLATCSFGVMPSLTQRIVNFGSAMIESAKQGFKMRSKEEIEHIFDTYCTPCPYFNGSACLKADCGCNISKQEQFLNKLAHASEKCPIGKW